MAKARIPIKIKKITVTPRNPKPMTAAPTKK
jgi:hypothetical protein